MKVNIYKNFLDQNFFLDLKNTITNEDFPWRFRKKLTIGNKTNETFYFTFSFFNELNVNSDLYYKFIIPILKQLNCLAPIQIRANLNLSKNNTSSDWHIDYPVLCKTAILYLNNCNGKTELQLKDKIKTIESEENKIVIFDSNIKHRGVIQTDTQTRYLINFNYFSYEK